jgi:hypothetical protein
MSGIAARLAPVNTFAPKIMAPAALVVIAGSPVLAGVLGDLGDWSPALIAVVALVPMFTVVIAQVYWTEQLYGVWLAFFGIVALPQLGHFGEHLAQMTQMHIMGTPTPEAKGAVGALNIEWVHFIWNGWVLIGVGILMMHFRRNPWLWASMGIGAWHFLEHLVIMISFWQTGKPGDPGLLSKGGDIGGGLPLIRPDLHFIYNLIMTLPLILGFAYSLREAREKQGIDESRMGGGTGLPSGARA